ncbi:MAG: TonB family protein [Myxococcota bacterium]|nr:TonB family protein [Myxococcota bacterium]
MATKVQGLTIAVSVAIHAVLSALLMWVAYRSLAAAPLGAQATQPPLVEPGSVAAVDIDLPAVAEGALVDHEVMDPIGEPPRVTGGDARPHLDTGARGHGGDLRASVPALNLADRDDRARMSPDLLSRLDRDQLQRLRVARVRQSWDDRRATTHPAELTFVATGAGSLVERRTSSATSPNRGTVESPAPRVRGGSEGASLEAQAGSTYRSKGAASLGAVDPAPGTGLFDARVGVVHHAAAPTGSARPDVARAPVSVPANESARPKDDVDSEQEVATAVRALIHASTAGGLPGEGQGGSGGPGEAGAGGTTGPGAEARPLGVGESDVFDYWTTDPRLLPYFRRIHARIDPLWADAFPRSALLDLKQGTVILEFTVFSDGHVLVSWPPFRASGIDEFDRNCADAIRRAAPLPRPPPELRVSSLRIRAPFVAANPIVK